MNFALFEAMDQQEAHEHLRGFLETERAAVDSLRGDAERRGVPLDFSIASLPSILRWFLGRVRIVRVPVPTTEPEWIRDWHKDGLIDFDKESKYWILRAAYYLGECFVHSCSSLRWATGDPEYVEKNMPVVAGFRSGKEMAPMVVVENLFSRILGDGAPSDDIDTAISAWARDVSQTNGCGA
jgi:hypothetical protein